MTTTILQVLRPHVAKPCGHTRHVGTCSACQRAQLSRWQDQLALATAAGARADDRRRRGARQV